MIKYYKELEIPDNNHIPLMIQDDELKQELSINNLNIPLSFFDTFKNLWHLLNEAYIIAKTLDLEDAFKELEKKDNYNETMSMYTQLENFIYENLPSIDDIQKSIITEYSDLEYILSSYEYLFTILEHIYPERKEELRNKTDYFNKVLTQLTNYSTIQYKQEKNKNMILPDAWYITPNGKLYNSGDKIYGHKQTNLVYPYNDMIKKRIIVK